MTKKGHRIFGEEKVQTKSWLHLCFFSMGLNYAARKAVSGLHSPTGGGIPVFDTLVQG